VLLKKAIITGATGFLGFSFLKELIHNKIYVYALCRKNSSRISRLNNLPNVTMIEADLNCLDDVNGLEECDTFYHLAWEGERNDFEKQYRNVEMAVNCLKLSSKLGCKRFICTGSQAEYGSTNELITEETPLKPTTAYGACKAAAYYLTSDLAKRLKTEHVWARVFSAYGPNDNPNSLIPYLIENLQLKNEATLQTDGEHIWNYLYEEDVARALRLLGQNEGISGTYNVASCESKPLKEYVEALHKVINADSVVRYGTGKSDVNLNVSVEKLRRDVGEFEVHNFINACTELL
jgi:nucleoside-diphosphate-sugar epimerase